MVLLSHARHNPMLYRDVIATCGANGFDRFCHITCRDPPKQKSALCHELELDHAHQFYQFPRH
jgi:hypothetical protein